MFTQSTYKNDDFQFQLLHESLKLASKTEIYFDLWVSVETLLSFNFKLSQANHPVGWAQGQGRSSSQLFIFDARPNQNKESNVNKITNMSAQSKNLNFFQAFVK